MQDCAIVQEKRAAAHQRRVLVETIRASAQWRGRKADEFADDKDARRENSRAALALRRLANFVDGLPANDPELNLPALARTEARDGRLVLATEASVLLSRFGLGYGSWKSGPPDESQMRNVLRRLDGIEARERAARKQRAEDGYGDE
jgi:hypothetical protein